MKKISGTFDIKIRTLLLKSQKGENNLLIVETKLYLILCFINKILFKIKGVCAFKKVNWFYLLKIYRLSKNISIIKCFIFLN